MCEFEVKRQIAESLRDSLFEFTMTYLLKQPKDFKEFTTHYFKGMQKQPTKITYDPLTFRKLSDEYGRKYSLTQSDFLARRNSVCGDSFDPRTLASETYEKPVHKKSPEENEELHKMAQNTLLFRTLDEAQLEDVINAMFKRIVQEGEVVITQGDAGDNFYVVESGIFNVYIRKGEVCEHVYTYENCGSFGELALLYDQPRVATIVAMSDGVLWALDRETFRMLVMKSAYERRERYKTLIESTPLFEQTQPYEKLILGDVFTSKRVKKGQQIMKQGAIPDGIYFVEEGKVSLTIKNRNGKDEELITIEPPGYFGELSLLTNRSRVTSAYATEDTMLAFLNLTAFDTFMKVDPCVNIMKENFKRYETKAQRILGPTYFEVIYGRKR